MKRLLLLIPLLVAGCGTKVSEEGEARCLREASYIQNNFVAQKVYERCRKNVMAEIKEEEKIAKAELVKKELKAARKKILDDDRAAKIGIQNKEFNNYTDWRFWGAKLTFPGKIIKPSCVIHEKTKVLYQDHDWRDRYGNRDAGMDDQICWAPGSIVFDKKGFKYIDIRAYYIDIGSNPPGPRGNGYEGQRMKFPTYDINANYINCSTKESDVRFIARITKLLESDPESFNLGQGDRAERVVSSTDPVTQKNVTFSKPLWVVKQNHPKFSVGRVGHIPTLNKLVNPICAAHRKFWSNEKFSG